LHESGGDRHDHTQHRPRSGREWRRSACSIESEGRRAIRLPRVVGILTRRRVPIGAVITIVTVDTIGTVDTVGTVRAVTFVRPVSSVRLVSVVVRSAEAIRIVVSVHRVRNVASVRAVRPTWPAAVDAHEEEQKLEHLV
jgi:hypothetical protein